MAVAIATMPSLRPVKPSCSLVVDPLADGVAMRTDARLLAHDGEIEMSDLAAALGHAVDCEFQELVG